MRIWNIAAAAALVFAAAPASASYVTGNINTGADGSVCGAVNEPFLQCPDYTGPVSLDIGNAQVQTDFGVNKVAVNGVNQAASEWMVVYGLTGASLGTPVDLVVEIAFDLNIMVANNSASEFRMVLNNNTLFPFIIRTATNGLGNRCDDLGNTAPCTTGDHMGIWTQNVTAAVGSNNRMTLFVGAGTTGGLVDAYNTARINRIIVPDGIGWTYDGGLAGNPLNFQYASATNAVPEPSSLALFACGIALQAFHRLRKRNRR